MKSRNPVGFALSLVLAAVACAHQEPDDINAEDDSMNEGGTASAGKGAGGTASPPRGGSTSTGTSGAGKGGSSSLPPVGSNGGKGGTGSGGKGGKGGSGGASGASGSAGMGAGGKVNEPIVGLSVEFKPADTGEMVSWMGGELSVINDTAQPLTVADLKIRYYFTDDMAGAPNPTTVAMNWAQCGPMNNLGGATCTGEVLPLAPSKPTANSYVELTCTSAGTPELTAGTLLKASWKAGANGNSATQYQKDDHSFSDPTHIVVLNGDTIVWGVEP